MHWDNDYDPNRRYQLVVMTDEGKCYCVGRMYDYEDIKDAVKELRDLYEKHGITHKVGYREV